MFAPQVKAVKNKLGKIFGKRKLRLQKDLN